MLRNLMLKQIERRLLRERLPVHFEFWNGKVLRLSDSPRLVVKLRSPKALDSLARPTLGRLAQSYIEQHIDLSGSTREIVGLGESLCGAGGPIVQSGRRRLGWRRHTRASDRRAISHHYDVSNDFYALWLDRRRVCSCAYFRKPEDDLDRAQEQKLEHICRKLNLRPGERFLDIGCGWGGLMLWAAEHYGVRAEGITLSRNQFEHVQSELAHLSQVTAAMSRERLECLDVECLRPHYAKTLWHWVDRLEAGREQARRLVGEDRYRIWQIYMGGSAHAFERGWLSIFQTLAAKPLQDGAASYPLTREHMYSGVGQKG